MCLWNRAPVEYLDVPKDDPIVAYKYMYRHSADGRLASPLQHTVWRDGRLTVRHDRAGDLTDKRDFLRRRARGVYAYRNHQAARGAVGRRNALRYVVVRVHLWGVVAVHAREGAPCRDLRPIPAGYRATRAEIVKVFG